MIPQDEFFVKYSIDPEKFTATDLNWQDLEAIYEDFESLRTGLQATAEMFMGHLMQAQGVHSVRYRVKESEHVIEKIIRKKSQYLEQKAEALKQEVESPAYTEITIKNYRQEILDLIGLRALHLFKDGWLRIHEFISNNWDVIKKPVANYREGDSADFVENFEKNGCETKEHKYGYRSIHYVIQTAPFKEKIYMEVQVRTIYEEAWSEIDHTVRYPYHQEHPIFKSFLMILNRLSGSADEMGTFIMDLKHHLTQNEELVKQTRDEKDEMFKQLTEQLSATELKGAQLKKAKEALAALQKKLTDTENARLLRGGGYDRWNTMEKSMLEMTDFSNQFKTFDYSSNYQDLLFPKVDPITGRPIARAARLDDEKSKS